MKRPIIESADVAAMAPDSRLTSYVALLRGVNVGGHAVVSMKELKTSVERLGFRDVSTYINSGNIIFKDSGKDIQKMTKAIESGIKAHCKMAVRVVIKSQKELAAICKKMSVVRERMSRNVHHTHAIHSAMKYAKMIVIPIRRSCSSRLTKAVMSMGAPDGSL